MEPGEAEGRGPIEVRMSPHQEWMLKAAADLTGEAVARCVLSAATEHAQEILERAQCINVSDKAFWRFLDALDAPIEDMPTLRRYARRQSSIPTR
jgi:uncharacterized protein (DUF1778 family)